MKGFVFFVCLVANAVVFAGCSRGPAPGPLHIEGAGGALQVTGLSGAELRSLSHARLDETAWQHLFTVRVSEASAVAVAGRYEVSDHSVAFRPALPFEAGRSYQATFDPARLPAPRSEPVVTAFVRIAAPARSARTAVAAIFPSASVWPENMLRFYVHFSAPMSRGAGTKFVHLLDDAGEEMPDAILAAYADLWNDDATRLTVFLDPGRVKRGVGPNVALGRAIVRGRKYAVAVDAAWPDAEGQPLVAPFRREFTAGPAAYSALSTSAWRVDAPAAGTRAPLVVTFPAPLDRALLERSIGVDRRDRGRVAGLIEVGAGETTWRFVPQAPWAAGAHQLAVQTVLEDPAGNKIGRAFEVLPSDPSANAPDAGTTLVTFTIR